MNSIEQLRQMYIDNPPLGHTKEEIKNMTDSEILDIQYILMTYFFND